ncbi:hypothetical protein OsI_20856 [Oryza sativa Indica Group]|uniref:Uncharacterized protein n=2 Tax=Oryza TaxID=4527 RepID=A0A0E0HHP6_ORYNI|nr:hypothetical protein OsI_20856 [Oryza sativa Indica Group]
MESSSRSPCICKLLPMLMLHVVLLAPPLLQARPLALGHGHRLLESSPPVIMLPTDDGEAVAAASPGLDVPGQLGRSGGAPPPPQSNRPVTPLAGVDGGVSGGRAPTNTPPSPQPGGSTKPLSDDDGKPPLGIAPPPPQGNKPPITSPRLRTSTDPPLRPPAPADDAAGLLRLIRDAVEYVIGELEA